MAMTLELKPCPFCGMLGPFDQWPCEWLDGKGGNVVRCPNCHGAAPLVTWNERVHLTPPAQAVDVDSLYEVIRGFGYTTRGQSDEIAEAVFEHITTRALAGEKAGWRDIATAPKDGTRIMLTNGHGVWMADYQPVYPSGYRPSNPWSSVLLNHEHMPLVGRHKAPTHWMPLPTPPTDGEE